MAVAVAEGDLANIPSSLSNGTTASALPASPTFTSVPPGLGSTIPPSAIFVGE